MAHSTTISGVKSANGMRNMAAKNGTKANTISTPRMFPVYMLAISPQTNSGFSLNRSDPGCSPQIINPPSITAAAAEQGAPIKRCEQDDGGCGRHPQGQRQQDSHPVGAPQPGQHSDDRPP